MEEYGAVLLLEVDPNVRLFQVDSLSYLDILFVGVQCVVPGYGCVQLLELDPNVKVFQVDSFLYPEIFFAGGLFTILPEAPSVPCSPGGTGLLLC